MSGGSDDASDRGRLGVAAVIAICSLNSWAGEALDPQAPSIDVRVTNVAGVGPEVQVLLANDGQGPVWAMVTRRAPVTSTCSSRSDLPAIGIGRTYRGRARRLLDDMAVLLPVGGWGHRIYLPVLEGAVPPCDLILDVFWGHKAFGFTGRQSIDVRIAIPPVGGTEPLRLDGRNPVTVRSRIEREGPSLRGPDIPLAEYVDLARKGNKAAPQAVSANDFPETMVVSLLIENVAVQAVEAVISDRGFDQCTRDGEPHARWALREDGWRGVSAGPVSLERGGWAVLLQALEARSNASDCSAWFEVSVKTTQGWRAMPRVTVPLGDVTDAPYLPLF